MPNTPQKSQYNFQLQELIDQFKFNTVKPIKDKRVFIDLNNKEKSIYKKIC